MQFDRTHIEIRNRSENELLDIALHVIRRFPLQILLTFALVAVPLLLLNNWILGHILTLDYNLAIQSRQTIVETTYTSSDISFGTFIFLQILLIITEAPLASILSTVMLSKLIFDESPTIGSIIQSARLGLGPIIKSCLFKRGILIMIGLMMLMMIPDSLTRGLLITSMILFFFIILLVRAARPFVLEIILLEHPGKSDAKDLTLSQRSRMLHTTVGGNVFARSMQIMIVSSILALCIHGFLTFLSVSLFTESGTLEHTEMTARWIFPIACWLAVLYASVVRFLNYLDTRIMLEGWEAELKIRSEAYKLEQRQQLSTDW